MDYNEKLAIITIASGIVPLVPIPLAAPRDQHPQRKPENVRSNVNPNIRAAGAKDKRRGSY